MVSICQLNISGLSAHSSTAIDHYCSERGISVLALQETGTIPGEDIFKNLKTFGVDDDRGVTISVANKFQPQRITSLEVRGVGAIFVIANPSRKPVMYASVYNSPTADLNKLLSAISTAWSYCQSNGVPTLQVMGDFNARGQAWGDRVYNSNGHILETFCNQYGIRIYSPMKNTFLCTGGGSVIDLMMTFGNPGSFGGMWVDEEDGLSLFTGAPDRGHLPVHTSFGHQTKTAERNLVFEYDKADWDSWTDYVEDHLPETRGTEDTEELYRNFLQVHRNACEQFIPKKTICRYSKPFWTNELSDLSKKLQQALKHYQFRRTSHNKEAVYEARTNFKEKLIASKNKWLHERLHGLNVHDSVVFWKRYRAIFLTQEENFIGCLESGGSLKHDHLEKEDILFRTYFEGEHLKNKDFDEDEYQRVYRKVEQILAVDLSEEEPEEEDLLNKKVEPEEVEQAIAAQDWSGKSTDGDGIQPRTLKHLGVRAVNYLTYLFNQCMRTSTWPWITSTVSFIKKNGKTTYLKPGSYRPITISMYIGKLLERVLDRRMRDKCYIENLLDEEQEGFLPNRSCTRYLYRLLATLHENRRRKFTSYLLLIDFEKAFDSVPIPFLILKIHRLGIRGRILKLLHAMLSYRYVKLKINGKIGRPRTCGTTGLPQGAVLSPLLFILYIGDLLTTSNIPPEIRHHTEGYKFADDGTVMITGSEQDCISSMKRLLQYVYDWCRTWRLVVNCGKDKTEILVIRPKRAESPPYQVKFFLGNEEVRYADSSKVLGVYLDKDLSFQQHAAFTLRKCWHAWTTVTAGTTRTEGLNGTALALLFKTVVLTKLLYAAPLWLEDRLDNFKDLMTRAKLKILGSQYYISDKLADILTTVPPLKVTLEVLTVKFVLKGILAHDGIAAKLLQIDSEPFHKFAHHLTMAKRYLSWTEDEEQPPNGSRRRSFLRNLDLMRYDPEKLIYSKETMEEYLFTLWDKDVKSSISTLCKEDEFTLEPRYSTEDLQNLVNTKEVVLTPLLHRGLSRSESTAITDFSHGHNLRFQNFAFRVLQYNSSLEVPTCLECGLLPDSSFHKLFECVSVGEVSALRQELTPISKYEFNYRIALVFCTDRNLVLKFRQLVATIIENSFFDDQLLN